LEVLTLKTARTSLTLTPDFGARVLALVDRRTGRDWIMAGPCTGSATEDAVFGGAEATGWDECFPTVGSCARPDGGMLRDHGDLWGRPWRLEFADGASARTSFVASGWRFSRTMELTGSDIICNYRAENLSAHTIEYLWAMHALFALTLSDRIRLPAGARCQASYRNDGRAPGVIHWPSDAAFPLDEVQSRSAGFAAKLQFDSAPREGVVIGNRTGALLIKGDGAAAASLGLWLCYGGWPQGGGVHQVAIEPTSAPYDDLVSARLANRAVRLAPGESVAWRTQLTLLQGLDD